MISKKISTLMLLHHVSEKGAFLFLLELCQISTNFNKFWQKDGQMTETVCYVYMFHLTSLMSLHYLVSSGSPWAIDFLSLYKIWRNNVERRRNYGLKSKSKMAAVRHLGFVTSSYRTTHKVSSFGHIGPSNFMLIRCIVLKI